MENMKFYTWKSIIMVLVSIDILLFWRGTQIIHRNSGIAHTLGESQENHGKVGFREQKCPLRSNHYKNHSDFNDFGGEMSKKQDFH